MPRRRFLALLLLPLLLLSGCLWQRLSRLADALAHWDDQVEVTWTDSEYSLRFKQPVLLEADARELGFHPTAIEGADGNERWTLVFRGEGLPDAVWQAGFEEGRLATITLPRSLAGPVLPPPLLRQYARLLGTGDVSVRQRRVLSLPPKKGAPVEPELPLPTLETVRTAFGLPTTAKSGPATTTLAYRLSTTETERTRFTVEFTHDEDGTFQQALIRWPEGLLVLRPKAIEAWLPSSYRKAQEAAAARLRTGREATAAGAGGGRTGQ